MRKIIINGRVNAFKYEDVVFKDKKTGDPKEIKKITCFVKDMESNDTILPIEFWGQTGMDAFLDIMEGDPVVAAFIINTREGKDKRYFISFKGVKIQKYLGMSMEEKQQENQIKNAPPADKTFAEMEFEKSEFANYTKPEKYDLPF